MQSHSHVRKAGNEDINPTSPKKRRIEEVDAAPSSTVDAAPAAGDAKSSLSVESESKSSLAILAKLSGQVSYSATSEQSQKAPPLAFTRSDNLMNELEEEINAELKAELDAEGAQWTEEQREALREFAQSMELELDAHPSSPKNGSRK